MSDAPAPLDQGPPEPRKTLAPSQAAHRLRAALVWTLVALVFAGAVLLAIRRMGPSSKLPAALAELERLLADRHRPEKLGRLRAACRSMDCGCVAHAAAGGLDLNATREVERLLDASRASCEKSPDYPGLRAELLVRSERLAEGERAALAVLATAPRSRYALQALALVNGGDKFMHGIGYAHQANVVGRGATAARTIGLFAYGLNDLDTAERHFRDALQQESDDLESLYNLALIAQRKDRYGEARQGYLKLLARDPAYQEARYNLAVLAHSIGAQDEAKHHLSKLRALKPPRAMLDRLEQILAVPVKRPGAALPATSAPGSP